ncbi:hypothetical protein BRC83_00700 [Halobacteriales archaeon QS_1_68_17]|nr:MAG: hypothetical protein BRC83_00700 [Halobacteriales archaeon QS_1_68_17]
MGTDERYVVYFRDRVAGIDPPLRTDSVEFYDSGVRVTREGGRDFFPYEVIGRIRERTAGGGAAGTEEGSPT